MIQSAQVASKFTLFTHHAKTFPNLVTALRNSMLRAGVFKNEKTAEEQVVQVLNFDIHLVKDFRGRRYIERITECIPVEEKNEYTFDHRKEKTFEGKFDKFADNATIFFTKTTNRELYKYRNVLEFDGEGYVLTNPISEQNIIEMRENMEDYDVKEFDAFLQRNWGITPPSRDELIAQEKAQREANLKAAQEAAKKEAEVEAAKARKNAEIKARQEKNKATGEATNK
jgi:pilus assembly protein CpaF